MKKTMTYYHAGCPVCLEAEENLLDFVDGNQFSIEKIHLGEDHESIAKAESAGVKSVPALVLDGQVFHINFGANLSDIK